MNRRQFLGRAGAAALVLAITAITGRFAVAADDEVFTGPVKGVAVDGFDPVAYFTQNMPVPGDEAITTDYRGATWRFASQQNRDAFVADPERYAPQYGGYCAYAVASGYTAKADPQAWKIVDGKLYLNYSKGVQQRWVQDIPGNITKADANWPSVLK